jgi:RNA polymerase sigma factor (sigma-70 family)
MELMATTHYRRIVGFLRKHASARTQSIEVAFQDSMVRFHELASEGGLGIRGDVLSWVMWFCLRTLRNERQRRISPAHEGNWSRLDDVIEKLEARNLPGPPTLTLRKEALEEIHRVKRALPARMREVLNLHLVGLSVQEIATRLGIAAKTAYDVRDKALSRVLLEIAPDDDSAPPPTSTPGQKASIKAAIRTLPAEIRQVLQALHEQGLSLRKAAAGLGLSGTDEVARLRDEGYRLLSRKLGLPFPETFDYLS